MQNFVIDKKYKDLQAKEGSGQVESSAEIFPNVRDPFPNDSYSLKFLVCFARFFCQRYYWSASFGVGTFL